MSDMVIFISLGKKAGFHAVGAFILVSGREMVGMERKRVGEAAKKR